VEVDPLASMRCWAVTVELGGQEFEIPALPAADWWPVLVEADPGAVLDLLKSNPEELDLLLLSGQVSSKELGATLMEAVEEATGRSFHVGFVLATVASQHWPVVGGQLALKGFRWDVMPIGAALDAIHSLIVAGMTEDNLVKFEALLDNEALTQPGKKRSPSARVMTEFETMAGPRPAPSVPGQAPP
jgi:hypothetical protein